jgi:hypothetical protein
MKGDLTANIRDRKGAWSFMHWAERERHSNSNIEGFCHSINFSLAPQGTLILIPVILHTHERELL